MLRNRLIGAAQTQDAGKNAMMNKMSTALLARAFLPAAKDIKGAMSFLDLGIKFQIMLYELSSSLFWMAILEVSLFLFFQVLFLASPKRMAGIYFHVLHLPRGAIGLILVKIMPNSHDMLKTINIKPEAKIPFSKISEQVVIGMQTCVEQFSVKCQKLLILYAALTAGTLILDLISFFREIAAYGSTLWKDAFADVSLLILATAFIAIDLYYFAWVFCTMLKFPTQFSKFIVQGLCGYFKSVNEALSAKVSQYRGKP